MSKLRNRVRAGSQLFGLGIFFLIVLPVACFAMIFDADSYSRSRRMQKITPQF